MAKSDSDRFDQTLTNLPDTKAAGYKLGTDAVNAINAWMTTNGGDKAALGKLLSLGGIHFKMSEAERFMRHLKRGILLAYLTVGGGDKPGMKTVKTAFKNETLPQLRTRLKGYVDAAATPVVANTIHRAVGGFGIFEFAQSSWKYGNSRDEHEAADSFSKAAVLVNKAVSQGLALLNGPTQKTRFETWFGPTTTLVNVNRVKTNMRKMHDAICARTVKLYFRGNSKVEGKASDLPVPEPWSPDGFMHEGGYFGAAWRVQPTEFDQTKTHMLLGGAFFTALRHGADSCAGVIIHELSHSEAQTHDHPFPGPGGGTSYGHACCQWLATNRPDLAVTNADNYEYYCEEFWQGVFAAKPQYAVNPIPDDAKHKIQSIL